MKLFKKVLAAALAGVLALSVLTGCGSGSGTVDYTSQVVKALNNAYAEAEEEITVTEGDAAMKAKLKRFVSKVLDSDVSFDGVTDIIEAITEDEKLAAEIKKMFPTAVLDDSTKPLYNIGMAQIEQSINDSNIKRYAQEMVDDNSVELNYPEEIDGDDFDEGMEWTVVVTTVTINNQEYLVGLFSRQVYTLAVEE